MAHQHPVLPLSEGGKPLHRPLNLAVVAPCFNEETILEGSAREILLELNRLKEKGKISPESGVYFVDDGSSDRTWPVIQDLHRKNPEVRGFRLSRNFGHQGAILAGMLTLKDKVDCVVTIDADLQDETGVLERFVDLYQEGNEIVYGVRRGRDTDTFFKRHTAQAFYHLMEWMGVEIVYNHGDYRLVGRRPLEALSGFQEVNLFLRGVFPAIGFRHATVEYDRKERVAGETKFPPLKMLTFALNGITSFSIKPLRFIAVLGAGIFSMSLALSLWALLTALYSRRAVHGWGSTVLPIYLLGGLQTIFMGIVGEYVGRIYQEVKGRPRFIIAETLD